MNSNELYHHGIKGMRWGIRRFQKRGGTQFSAKAKRLDDVDDQKDSSDSFHVNSTKLKKKQIRKMSDDELRKTIDRLNLEKKCTELMLEVDKLPEASKKVREHKGRKFMSNILEASGKNIMTQYVTYLMGTTVNKMAGSDVVNPKKGQKDK